ncbi:MAG: C-terminal glycine zipper region [Acidobacteriota bacterium]|jgi:ElaB/YqjD/DUF883 family membrane-anchored ribosome-binding protein|nr:C-terminal glycine zipper region [Acidobacteriota bacterium]MDT7781224.1 C-terminal glycine zipper region [Acidobacteriota bacterium]
MSQNRPDNDKGNTSSKSGGAGSGSSSSSFGGASSGATDAGTTRDTSTGLSTSGIGSSAGTATAPDKGGIAAKAKEYGQTVADAASTAASTAKEFLSDKASVVGDKFQDLRNVDYEQVANQAKDYARQNPGQALLVAAAAGFLIGLLVRGGRK